MRSGGDEVKNITVRPSRRRCAAARDYGGGSKQYLCLANHRHIVCIPSVCKFCENVNTLLANRNEMMNECVTKLLHIYHRRAMGVLQVGHEFKLLPIKAQSIHFRAFR